jgi:hypothetical protein
MMLLRIIVLLLLHHHDHHHLPHQFSCFGRSSSTNNKHPYAEACCAMGNALLDCTSNRVILYFSYCRQNECDVLQCQHALVNVVAVHAYTASLLLLVPRVAAPVTAASFLKWAQLLACTRPNCSWYYNDSRTVSSLPSPTQ